jgi:hypothetical protein
MFLPSRWSGSLGPQATSLQISMMAWYQAIDTDFHANLRFANIAAAVFQFQGRLDCRLTIPLVTNQHGSRAHMKELKVFWQLSKSVIVGTAAIAIVAVMLVAVTVRDCFSSILGRD